MADPVEPKSGTNRAPNPQPPAEPPFPQTKYGLGAWVFGQVLKMRQDQLLILALLCGFGYILFESMHKQNEQTAIHQRQLEEGRERDRQTLLTRDKMIEDSRERDRINYQELRKGDRDVLIQLGTKIERHSAMLERIEAAMWGRKLPPDCAPMPRAMGDD